MNDFQRESTADVSRTRFQLRSGWDVLAEWADTASQSRKNAVYAALFSMVDRTIFATHHVVGDPARPNELYVAIKDDLVLKTRVNGLDSFDVLHVGGWEQATEQESDRLDP